MSCASLRLARAALLALACACDEPSPPRSALVVTLDTTRADALGCYGGERVRTPSLDRLASMGLLFERASTSTPLTLPAHASLWTGLYPPRHGVRVNGMRLPASATTLAERARAAGFQTAAFVGNVVLDPSLGLDQGFELYSAPGLDEAGGERAGVRVAVEAIAWLQARDRTRPFLLWVHVFDPHDPYEPPERFAPPPGVHPYYGEIAAADAALGGLLAWLEEQGLLADTVVVVAGDHGEALGEHGEVTHGDLCFEPTIHVPLLLAGPGVPRGARSRELAGLVDVAPTLAALLGLDWPAGEETDGRDLLGASDPGRGVYFECYTGWLSYGWSPLAGWRDERGKYLASARPVLVRPEEDPAEERDLLAAGEADAAPYRAALAALFERPVLAPDARAAAGTELDPALAARLQAMGYAAGASAAQQSALPSPLDDTGRPAPSERADEHARALQAHAWVAEGRYAEAEAAFERIVRENPAHLAAWNRLAFARAAQKDFAGALVAIEAVLSARPDDADAHVVRGRCLLELGRHEEALAAFARALALAPRSRTVLESMAGALEAVGRAEEAGELRALLETDR